MHFGSGVSRVLSLLIDGPKQFDLHHMSRFYCIIEEALWFSWSTTRMLIEKMGNRNVTDKNGVNIRDLATSQTEGLPLNTKPGFCDSRDIKCKFRIHPCLKSSQSLS